MKNKLMCLFLASAACMVQPAMAAVILAGSQLNTGGTLHALNSSDGTLNNAAGLNFTVGGIDNGAASGALMGVAGAGTFNAVNCTVGFDGAQSCGLIADIESFANFAGSLNFLSGLPEGISFFLNAPLTVTRAAGSANSLPTLIISGTGTLMATGFDPTSGIFTLVTQGGIDTTYSASVISIGRAVAPIPEPASFLLMGGGVAGLMLARRRKARQS